MARLRSKTIKRHNIRLPVADSIPAAPKRGYYQRTWPSILLSGGPQDGAIILYPQPLPEIIVTAALTPALVYHQYSYHDLFDTQKDAAIVSYTYHHQFTYRINEFGTVEVLDT